MKLMLIYLVIGAIFAYFFGGAREGEYGYQAFIMIFWPLLIYLVTEAIFAYFFGRAFLRIFRPLCVLVLFMAMIVAFI